MALPSDRWTAYSVRTATTIYAQRAVRNPARSVRVRTTIAMNGSGSCANDL
jgi:hypothetical protein